jgi:epoxyqueuosine reductase
MHTPAWTDRLKQALTPLASGLGFDGIGISLGPTLSDQAALSEWLALGYHGEMAFMARWGKARAAIQTTLPTALRVISVRKRYFPAQAREPWSVLNDPTLAYISRYALNRDYHKIMRPRLAQLGEQIEQWVHTHAPATPPRAYRALVDSAPLMEKPAAREAGLGFIGRHTNLIDARSGSWFFLGELLTDIPFAPDTKASAHCGSCQACLPACPTGALSAQGHIDARRCISYLTIEHPGRIEPSLRRLMGNRIYGCDDCQLVCPFNSFTQPTDDPDFAPRHALDQIDLLSLWHWSEAEFLARLAGSPIRRIGFERFSRNLAIALGNAPYSPQVINALQARLAHAGDMLTEHIEWAIAEQHCKQPHGARV